MRRMCSSHTISRLERRNMSCSGAVCLADVFFLIGFGEQQRSTAQINKRIQAAD